MEGALDYLRALRPHHWVKNILVFVPLVAAHETEIGPWLVAVAMFVALSACASGTYLFNDLLDLAHDRRSDTKRHRPMAAGRAPLLPMIGIGTALAAGGTLLGFGLSVTAGLCILLYLAVTFAYSLWLKRLVLVDIVVLALLYGIRILAGAAPLSIMPSPWLFAFAMFIFLALAIVKRQRG
ncbi:MAG: UbiA family prenyltransferase [Alphaproteobacteria bacterium]|nr:UbiA family prenyltransferase [Alphaproteobacteria bacterium]